MSYRILTEAEFEIFAASERGMYSEGSHAWSDIRDRHDSEGLAMLWDDAVSFIELEVDDPEDKDYILSEAGRRVAVAQFYALIGDLPPNAEERKADVKDGQVVNSV
jgi:hypothetical protein